jgi:hypothetical protein
MKFDISAEPAAPPEAGVIVHVRKGEDMGRILVMPKRYEGRHIEYCEDCPFFNDGAGYEYGVGCGVGGSPEFTTSAPSPRGLTVEITTIPDDCPLPEFSDEESD